MAQPGRFRATAGTNNSVFVCRAGEPDLDFLIQATRHVALHRTIRSNYQVGGQLIQGLREALDYEVLVGAAMFSPYLLRALARGEADFLAIHAQAYGAPVHAANLCATDWYYAAPTEAQILAAMDRLEASQGGVVNGWLTGGMGLERGRTVWFEAPQFAAQLGLENLEPLQPRPISRREGGWTSS